MVSARGLLDTNLWHINALPYQFLMLHAWMPELSWNTPAWSISAEWAAYICFPIIAFLILQRLPIVFAFILLVATFALFQVVVVENTGVGRSWLGYPAAVRIAAEFSYGVFIYRLVQLARPRWCFDWFAALAFFVSFLIPSVPLLQILLFGVMIAAISLSNGWLATALSTDVFVLLGNASYAVYMVHFPAIKLIQNFNALFGIERPEPWIAHIMVVFWAAVITGCGVSVIKTFGTSEPIS
jgi:peptidoglycan/LPS O-acetylase OafA/YrhL